MTKLLLPEWQGYGLSPELYDGARALAQAWWPEGPDLTIDAPRQEPLETSNGVLGLSSIAARLTATRLAIAERAPARLVTVGGTCGVELAPVSYCAERYGDQLAVVWLDAHGDLNTPESSPSGHFHGMVLRTLLGEGPTELVSVLPRALKPSQVFLAGARDLDPPEVAYLASSGVTHVGREEFDDPTGLATLLKQRGFTRAYVHFDVDVVDPGDFGGSFLLVPGGPLLAEVADVIGQLHRQLDVVGFSVLEYCDRDARERERLVTALRGAQLVGCCGR